MSFGALILAERNVLFFLARLVLSVKRFEQTRSTAWAVTAVVCAQFMLYFKETAFLLILGFAVGRLILRCRNIREAGWDYDRLSDKESRLDLCLTSLVLLYLLFYFVIMGILSWTPKMRQVASVMRLFTSSGLFSHSGQSVSRLRFRQSILHQ